MFRVPSFNYVGSKLGNGMLYSTADTRALIELLAAIRSNGDALPLIDGQETRRSEQTIGREVTPLVENLVARVDEEIVIDRLTPRHDLDFELDINPRKLKLGERTQLRITLNEDSICPLARVYLKSKLHSSVG